MPQSVVTYAAVVVVDVGNAERPLKPGVKGNVAFIHSREAEVLWPPQRGPQFRAHAATRALMTRMMTRMMLKPPPALEGRR
jgi:hypothetical protein